MLLLITASSSRQEKNVDLDSEGGTFIYSACATSLPSAPVLNRASTHAMRARQTFPRACKLPEGAEKKLASFGGQPDIQILDRTDDRVSTLLRSGELPTRPSSRPSTRLPRRRLTRLSLRPRRALSLISRLRCVSFIIFFFVLHHKILTSLFPLFSPPKFWTDIYYKGTEPPYMRGREKEDIHYY